MPTSTPTELESCVLACIAREGAATAYQVRRFLARSASTYWSDSAGSIYPLLDRLERRGWVRAEKTAWGTRTRSSYRLRAAGTRILRRWLSAPLGDDAVGHTFDPVRARLFFLDLVPSGERRGFVEDALTGTRRHLERHRTELREKRGSLTPWAVLGREGAIRELEARAGWLEHVLGRLDSLGPRND